MIQIDDYTVNPFDIKETEEVAIMPAFKIDYKRVDVRNFVSVTCEMLFSPNVSVLSMIKGLISRGIDQSEVKRIFVGKIVQTKYQSWAKYLKITDIMFDESLDNYCIQKNGRDVTLLEYFQLKYPFVKIDSPNQFLVKAVPVNNRFETIKR